MCPAAEVARPLSRSPLALIFLLRHHGNPAQASLVPVTLGFCLHGGDWLLTWDKDGTESSGSQKGVR